MPNTPTSPESVDPDMNYTHRQEQHIAIFELSGSLLADNARQQIVNDFNQYLDNGVHHFVVDLTNLQHVNSTGLGIFITLFTKVKSRSGDLFLCNPSTHVSNLMKITKLDTVFRLAASPAEAMEKLKAEH